jgi:hypothetical protein
MSISHLLVRLLLVPLGALLAGCTATLVAFLANWKVFLSVIGGDAMTGGDIVAVMVGLAMLLVGSAATFPMLLPAVIGITISEALAVRSLVFHVLNGVVSIWVAAPPWWILVGHSSSTVSLPPCWRPALRRAWSIG